MALTCTKCQSQIPADSVYCPACGADAPTDPGPEALTQPMRAGAGPTASTVLAQLAESLGANYQVRRVVGRGGFAEVYEVWDRNLERRLAAKVLNPDLVTSPGTLARFKQEAKTVAQLSHPAILPIHFVGDSDELAFYVMPFVEGDSLATLVEQRTKLPADEAIEIAKPVLEALAHAHDAGLIHRDVKPDNVMLEAKTGRVLLVDFGIAKALDPEKASHMTQAGFTVGTPHFMSPEQALADKLDARSDLYSFGAMLFEMVTGEKPFDGATSQEVVTQHISDPVRHPNEVESSVPDWLSDVIVRCLEKKPDDRFQSATEILETLRSKGGASETQVADDDGDVLVGDIIVGSGMSFDADYGPPEPATPKPPTATPDPPVVAAPPPQPEEAPTEEPEASLNLMSNEPPPAAPAATQDKPVEEPPPVPEPDIDRASVTMAASAAAAAVAEERRLERAEKRRSSGRKAVVVLPLITILGAGGWIAGTEQGRAWARGLWSITQAKVASFTAGDALHQYVTNSLVESVELLVNGEVVRTLGPGERDSLPLTGGTPPVLSWRLIQPRSQDGRAMGRAFTSVMSASVQTEDGDQHFAITSVASNRAMFTPVVTNGTNRPIVALINAGTPGETRCNCVIEAGSRGTNLGYYPLRQTSTIRFYDARQAYRGTYREVRNFADRVDGLSGSVRVSVPNR